MIDNLAVLAPAVAAGGAAGALLRWLVMRAGGTAGFTAGLLIVNLGGSLALGIFLALSWSSEAWLVVAIAFTGGLTTFSTLMVDIVQSARSGKWTAAVVTGVVHLAGGALLCGVGHLAVSALVAA